jgi:hypothetical protein
VGERRLSGSGLVRLKRPWYTAHQHLEEYGHAFWATADSEKALVSGYVTIAGLLRLPEADGDLNLLACFIFRYSGTRNNRTVCR